MLKHVLVPLDGSELARSALDYALKLLGDHGTITLVTVLQQPEVPIYDFYPVAVSTQTKDYEATFAETLNRAQSYLKRLSDDIREQHHYHVSLEIEAGDPATAIVEIAEKLKVDAIVMSTHGRSGLSRWLFGSVTQKVLAANVCPVFVIPSKLAEVSKAPEAAKESTPA